MEYNGFTKDELFLICEEKGIKTSKDMKKADIIALIEESEKENGSDQALTEAESNLSQDENKDLPEEGSGSDETAEEEADESTEEPEAEDEAEATSDNDDKAPAEEAEQPDVEGEGTEEDATIKVDPPKPTRSRTRKSAAAKKAEDEKQLKTGIGVAKNIRLRRREKVYNDGKGDILTIDADDKYKTLTEEERAERELIHSKSDANAVLSGKVISVKAPVRTFLDGKPTLIVFAVVLYKGIKVYIPSNLFLEHPEDVADENLLSEMQKRIGSEIDFVTKYIEEGDREEIPMKYVGSRVDAMAKKRQKYWYGKKRGKDGTQYRINPGDIVEARITAVYPRSISVEVFGSETNIFARELAYEYVTDARPMFLQGERIKVAITEVERDMSSESTNVRNGKFNIRYSASVKATKKDPRKIHYNEYDINQTCTGIVTQVVADDTLRFYVNVAGEIDVLCWMKEGVILLPEEGDQVSIKISRKYDDTQRFTGTITHVDGKR